MKTFTRLSAAFVLILSTSLAQAAINPNAATHGQWQSASGQTLSVGADGVRTYAQSADECRQIGGFSHKAASISGKDLQSNLVSTAQYHKELLPEITDSEIKANLRDNIQTINRAKTMIKPQQTYKGIALVCGDSSSELYFIDANNAIEQVFGGGESFYQLYRKAR